MSGLNTLSTDLRLSSNIERVRIVVCILTILTMLSCADRGYNRADVLNDAAYAWHYRDIDSVEACARLAFDVSSDYASGHAEALNNLAFVSLVRMDYARARQQLDSIPLITDNHLELLISYVQQMRLCQRRSSNREFYDYREKALRSLQRIDEERGSLSDRQLARLCYAETEMAIVTSTYYYYVGLERQSSESMLAVSHLVEQDSAQLMNYLYNVGAGGIINTGTQLEVNQMEFDHLMRCYLMAQHTGSTFFIANALEGLAEHMMNADYREQLIRDNLPAMKYLNPEGVSDDLLPMWLAEGALDVFIDYGDTYQIAGAYRTLASCHLAQEDYEGALFFLEEALGDSAINQAPDLVASIREQMSVAYAAIDDKAESDRNRNIYLDLQEGTRQDRQLEARAGQLEYSLQQTERLMWAVVLAVVVLVVIIALYHHHRRCQEGHPDLRLQEREEMIGEQTAMMRLNVERGERRHLEQRAKVSLVMGIIPFIDRILHAIKHARGTAGMQGSVFSVQYVTELTDEINRQNELLTHWIQISQGELSLRIESFPLQELFDMVSRSEHTFAMKGISLSVQPTTATVKADRVLTLFMLNTLADNARKFTAESGTVTISAVENGDYVEISVTDTGCGMNDEELAGLFAQHPVLASQHRNVASPALSHTIEKGHGFGLLNCKGIIDKYRKTSSVFSVCLLSAESRVGEGSRFFFRLPKGTAGRKMPGRRPLSIIGLIGLVGLMSQTGLPGQAQHVATAETFSSLACAAIYADSAYFSNINGTYERTLLFADSCRQCLNDYYREQCPAECDTLLAMGNVVDDPESPTLTPPEIRWLHDSLNTNFQIILDMRNESAVAALALHEWALYQYNNRIYVQLFKELSADNTLDDYCRKMQQSQTNRQVAVIILVLLFLGILGAVSWQLMLAIKLSARRRQEQQDRLDMMVDELQRLTMESNALHVSNAVLDNTLSTLKHETMYYPSRILQLVHGAQTDGRGDELSSTNYEQIKEVVAYYRDLYGLLSQQSMSQVETVRLHLVPLDHGILGDENLIRYLFELLRKENGQQQPAISYTVRDERYVECRVNMPTLQRTDLFTPTTEANISWLLCRQIVRDHGEATNRRACAIRTEKAEEGVTIVITLPRVNKAMT